MRRKQSIREGNPRRWHLAMTAVVCFMAVIYCLNDNCRVYVHFVVSQFCHGVSAGKILFFLGYVAVLQLIYAFYQPLEHAKRITWLFVGGISVGFLTNLITYLVYINSFNLSPSDFTFHWREGITSVNNLSHIHTGKVAIAWVIELLSLESLHSIFDTGAAYLDVIPTYLAVMIGVSFTLALASSFFVAPYVVTRYPSQERVVVGFIFSWILCSLCKCVLDGGPLAYDALTAMILLRPILVADTMNTLFMQLKKQLPICCLVLAAWMAILMIFQPGSLGTQVERIVVRSSLILFPLLLLWVLEQGRTVMIFRLAATAMGMTIALAGIKRSAEIDLFPLHKKTPAQLTLVSSSESENGQLMPIQKEQLGTDPDHTILQTYLSLNVSPYRCSTVSFANSETDIISNLVGRILLPANELVGLTFPEDDTVYVAALEPTSTLVKKGSQIDWIDCYLSVEFKEPIGISFNGTVMNQVQENERFFAYRLIDHHLRRSGLSQYILIPYGFLPKSDTDPIKSLNEEILIR